jgi:nitrogen fixation protein FixH
VKTSSWWPAGIVVVLGVTVVANLALLRAASSPDGLATEPDYYRKAVLWDSTQALARRSAATGWAASAGIERSGAGLVLRVTITDAGGAPVEGASVAVEAIHNLEAERHERLALVPERAGVYRAAMTSGRRGMWELRILARRGEDLFLGDLRREAPARAGG